MRTLMIATMLVACNTTDTTETETTAETAGETAGGYTPGLGEALATKDLYDVWSESGGRGEEKLAATAETGADLASSYAIASGNPYAMAGGFLYKGGKFAWDLLA